MDLVVLTSFLAVLAIVSWYVMVRFVARRREGLNFDLRSRAEGPPHTQSDPLPRETAHTPSPPEPSPVPSPPQVAERSHTDRPLAQALQDEDRLYQTLFEEDVAGILLTSVTGEVLDCNPAACRILGIASVSEARGLDGRTFYPADRCREEFLSLVRDRGKLELHEIDMLRTDGERIHTLTNVRGLFDGDGELTRTVGHFVDITEQTVLRKQLRNAQRMEAVGRLAGGIAHDFNNLLTTISGHADLLLMDPSAGDSVRADVARIKRASDQAGTLVQQLLAFSRQQVLRSRIMDLNQTMESVVDMVDRLIGEDIEVVTVPGREIWNVWADPGQMDQVLLNLVVNARDAMPGGGTLTLTSRNMEMEGSVAASRDLEAGQYVVLEAADTGIGISEADQARIFEPFFTTKDTGKGTGLGLAMAYGIVKQSGGHIEVDSAVGRGTSFRIFLPRMTGETHSVGPAEGGMTAPTGTETVLLVEDEQMVRSLAHRILRRQGYVVLEAEHGAAALAVSDEWVGPIHLLLTDLVLPDIDGRALAKHLAEQRPEMDFLYMSGYSKEIDSSDEFRGPQGPFLPKPFGPVELAQRVRAAIDQRSSMETAVSGEGPRPLPT